MTADGKPGQILNLMALATNDVATINLTEKGNGAERVSYKSAEDIKRAARAALTKHGIVTQWETSEQHSAVKAHGEIRVTAYFIAPDGTFLVHSVYAAAVAGMGRHYTVAVTAAVKQILSLALQLVTPGDDVDEQPEESKKEEWSDALREIVAAIDGAQTHAELSATSALPAWKGLTPEERAFARQQGEGRHNWLVRLQHAGRGQHR